MIDISHLSKTYPGNVRALNGISLSIGIGMFGLLGPNGAGKTTLMRIVAGMIRPTEGSVRVAEHDLGTHAGRLAAKAMLGYLPQELGLYPSLSAREFLDYLAIMKGINDPRARRAQIEELLDLVRLSDMSDRRLKAFSGGMKRRFGIAQALLGNPRLLIVDEPTVGLDPEERVRFRSLLTELARRCTVILSTHIIEDISASCNALAVLDAGRLLYQGSPADLVRGARGSVWTLTAGGEPPTHDATVVSAIQLADGVQYRLVGNIATQNGAQPAEPTLEDGYIHLMRSSRRPATA
jgi:ABC-type multidrug transport system ATPase subunit